MRAVWIERLREADGGIEVPGLCEGLRTGSSIGAIQSSAMSSLAYASRQIQHLAPPGRFRQMLQTPHARQSARPPCHDARMMAVSHAAANAEMPMVAIMAAPPTFDSDPASARVA